MGVIYPKYLTLPAVTTIYEYLESGRCDSLAGADGSYNLYESELRSNVIIARMDTIIESLEDIKTNQMMLYNVLHRIEDNTSMMNKSIDEMVNTVNDIKRNTRIAADESRNISYYSQIAANEASNLSFLGTFGLLR